MQTGRDNMKKFLGFILGLVVGGHALFLVVANVGRQLDLKPVQAICAPWEAATGNEQGWELFTRGRMPNAVFPEVEIEEAGWEPVVVRSRFEPTSPTALRPPVVGNRLFNQEMRLTLEAEFYSPEAVAEQPQIWRQLLSEAASRKSAAYVSYLDQVGRMHVGGPTATRLTLRIRRFVDGELAETLPWFRLTAPATERRAEWYNLVDGRWEAMVAP